MLLLSLLLAMQTAKADMLFGYGVGVYNSAKYSRAEVKTFSLGVQSNFNEGKSPFFEKVEGGLWADQVNEGRKSSGYGFYSLGVECTPSIFVLSSSWGVGAVTTPDEYLGSPFEFTQDFFLGVRDQKRVTIGIDYKHISNAGLAAKNKGRDFGIIKVSFPF